MKHSFETVIYPDMIICSMLSHLAMDNDNSYTTPSSSRQKLWHHSRILLHLIKHKENHAEGLVHLPTFPFHTISGLLQFRTNLRNLTNRLANIQKTPTSVERTMISIYFVSYTSIFWIFNTKRRRGEKLKSDKCLQTRYLRIDFTRISPVQSKWQIVLLYSRQQSL